MRITLALFLLTLLLATPGNAQEGNAEDEGQRLSILDPAGQEVGWYSESYALVIGASDYQDESWPDLPNVPRELNEVSKELRRHGFEVKGPYVDVTTKELKSAFKAFFETYGGRRSNRLVVYFSGHGYSFEGDDRGYLVPVDAPDPLLDRPRFLRRTLHMTRIMAWSRNIRPSHVLFLFDSCISHNVFRNSQSPDLPANVSVTTAEPVRQYISACRAGEKMPEESVFAPHVARALRGDADRNDDRYVTGGEIGAFLDWAVSGARQGQTLQYAKIRDPELNVGDIVFDLPRKRYEWLEVGTAQAPYVGPTPAGPAATRLLGIKLRNPKSGAAVEVLADGELAYSTFRLDNPLRFVIDLHGVVNKAGALNLPATSGGLSKIRVAQFKMSPKPIARIVFDMDRWFAPKIKTRKDGFYIRFPPPDPDSQQ